MPSFDAIHSRRDAYRHEREDERAVAASIPAAYAVTIDGRLYGYGETKVGARSDFRQQIAGASLGMQALMFARIIFVPLDADAASEAAECIDAPWDLPQ
jgi:hypothetical protein